MTTRLIELSYVMILEFASRSTAPRENSSITLISFNNLYIPKSSTSRTFKAKYLLYPDCVEKGHLNLNKKHF